MQEEVCWDVNRTGDRMSLLSSTSGDGTRRNPRVSWTLTWSVAAVLYLTGLMTTESTWRAFGYRPSATDSPALWKYWYERAANGGLKTIVLIGASRIQGGISTSQLREQLPDYQVVQLGQYGGDSPVGVLQALALDERFNGIVICDMLAPFLVRERWESQRNVYDSPATTVQQREAYENALAADFLAINNTESGIGTAVKQFVGEGRHPSPNHVRMRADRSIEIDFTLIEDLQEFRQKNAAATRRQYETAEHPSPEDLDDEFIEVDEFVRRIQDRGGQVVFLRMPTSGERLAIEEQYHPKTKYWDRFAAIGSGICIYWTELAGLGNLTCPDDSHLDYRDVDRFTNALVDDLIQRGIFKTR